MQDVHRVQSKHFDSETHHLLNFLLRLCQNDLVKITLIPRLDETRTFLHNVILFCTEIQLTAFSL